jgi:predicted PurR-regulated permease PerM/methylmalonyl-CoA mutase cobalamin-binding subunit
MTPPVTGDRNGKLSMLIGFTLITALLWVARDLLIPIALATLLAFLLTPLVVRLTRWRMPNVLAIFVTVTLAFTVIGSIGWLVTNQFISLVDDLPNYEQNIRQKIGSLKGPGRESGLSRASGMVEKLREEMKDDAAEGSDASTSAGRPIPVEVYVPDPSPVAIARQIASPLLGPLGTAGLVVVLVIVMLFQRNDLRERFIKIVSYGQLNLAAEAVDDVTQRIFRYLSRQLLVNAGYGIPVGIALYFIGIPNAALWGLLATLLRFIPFLGPWIAAAFPIALAFAVDPGWTMIASTVAVFVIAELVSNNVIEPWLYGASTGISTFALIIAALFWTWLWGPAGLFLSTPLTVCLIVLGKRVPALGWLHVVLGSGPAFDPPAQFYQRMLAMDADGMVELATSYVSEHSLSEFYDDVFAPALILAEEDRHRGALAEVRQRFILQTSRDVIEELERRALRAEPGAESAPPQTVPAATTAPVVLAVAARDDADELVAMMVAHLLRATGVAAIACPIATSFEDCAVQASGKSVKLALVSALPPSAVASARRIASRLREKFPELQLVIGIWSRSADAKKLGEALRGTGADAVVTRLADAVAQAQTLLATTEAAVSEPAPIPPEEPARLAAVHATQLLETDPEETFDAVTRELARVFDVPISLVTVVDAERQFWKSQIGLPPDLADAREAPRSTSMCGHVVAAKSVMVIEDTRKDRRFANNPFLLERGIRFYAGAPLVAPNGEAIGSLCIIDTKPRTISEAELTLLRDRAEQLSKVIAARQPPMTETSPNAAAPREQHSSPV